MKNVKFWVLLSAIMITTVFCKNNVAAQELQEQLLYERINSYLAKKQYIEAENAIDTAINKYPDNLLALYLVKGNIYVYKYTALMEKFKTENDKIDSLKKARFRLRNNASEVARIEGELAAQEKVAVATKADFMAKQDKAAECYKMMLAKDANNYDAYFMLGLLSYDKSEIIEIERDYIPLREDKDGILFAAKDKEIHSYWKKSCEWFEKAHKAKPNESNPLQNLKILYNKLGDTANKTRVEAELDKCLNSREVIASAPDNTPKNNNNTRIGSSEIAAVIIGYLIRGAASTVKDVLDSRGSYSSNSYSSSSYSSDSYSSSSSDLNKMDENQLADWWRSHKGTKISFEWEDYFSECDGWAKRNYKFIGYVDECQWSEFYVNIISISMLSSGFTTKENDDEVTSCVKRKYIGNHIRIYPSRIYKLTEE